MQNSTNAPYSDERKCLPLARPRPFIGFIELPLFVKHKKKQVVKCKNRLEWYGRGYTVCSHLTERHNIYRFGANLQYHAQPKMIVGAGKTILQMFSIH